MYRQVIYLLTHTKEYITIRYTPRHGRQQLASFLCRLILGMLGVDASYVSGSVESGMMEFLHLRHRPGAAPQVRSTRRGAKVAPAG